MSEYQYYDFRSLDKALTAQQQMRVSRLSSRAKVTAHHAQFVYNYGDFHGNIKQLMAEDFDMMLYMANWGTQRLMLRIPESLINIASLRDYFISDEVEHYRANKNIILDFHFNDDEGEGYWIEDEDEGMLDDFSPLREEIIRGDYRVLYLAWLKAAENARSYDDGVDDQTMEPRVPAGLGQLTTAQRKYAEWIELDKNLIKVAAEGSHRLAKSSFQSEDYLHYLSTEVKEDFLRRLCKNEINLSAVLNRHLETLHKARSNQPNVEGGDDQRRSFFTVYERYEQRKKKAQENIKKTAKIRAEQQRIESEREYQLKLDQLLGKEDSVWEMIDTLVERGSAKPYDLAVEHLSELYDLAKRDNKLAVFMQKTAELTTKYSRRVAFIRRVKERIAV